MLITKQRSARSCLFHLPTGAAGRGTSSGISCKGRICAQRRARPETRSWDVLGHAGAAGVRRRLGRAGLIPGSTWQQQMEEPRVIPAGVGAGRGGHDRRTKPRIYSCRPFTVSPSLPPCTGLFLHFLCFSCLLGHPGAGTHTKSEPWPSLSLCHRRCEPLCGPRSTVVPLIRLAERARGQAGLGACGAPLGILLCAGCGAGILRKGPQKVWACRLCPRSFPHQVWWRECQLT